MFRVFRKIRYKLLDEGHLSKYSAYAIGEILLVVIGILIALQINNWNEERKTEKEAVENYLNLETSLKQDLLQVRRVRELNQTSLLALSKIIPAEINESLLQLDETELNDYLVELMYSSRSFMPQAGVYNLITSNNGFDLIKSDLIKSNLINLYDYQYQSYKDLDYQIDTKYFRKLGVILREKIILVVEFQPELVIKHKATPGRFKQHYNELAMASRDIYSMVSFNVKNLIAIEESINKLIALIESETLDNID